LAANHLTVAAKKNYRYRKMHKKYSTATELPRFC